jgi:hypothetical protein
MRNMAVVWYWSVTLGIDFCLLSNFDVIIYSTYFRFCLVKPNYYAISLSMGDAQRTGTYI